MKSYSIWWDLVEEKVQIHGVVELGRPRFERAGQSARCRVWWTEGLGYPWQFLSWFSKSKGEIIIHVSNLRLTIGMEFKSN